MNEVVLKCRLPLADFALEIDASFRAQVTSIFGPSGAGKTSLLDTIAGIRGRLEGQIEIGGRILYSSQRGIDLPPKQRSIGYVPQEAALFPHLTVRKNILFGANRPASNHTVAPINFDHVAELPEIVHLLDRPVTRLSGGESQRVALARAIVSRPQLLLLDEPLASLDVGMKERIIPYLRRIRDEFGIPMIYVTHDVTEVLSLADWVVMIKRGRVIAQGVPQEILASKWLSANPDQSQVENIFDVRWLDGESQAGRSRVRLKSGNELFIPFVDKPADSFLQVRIRGDDILLATKRPEGISAGNVLKGVVKRIEIIDGQAILKVDAGEPFTVRLTAGAVLALRLREGQEAFLIVKTRSCIVL